jgi:uncharacterized protein (TIGR03435 family)
MLLLQHFFVVLLIAQMTAGFEVATIKRNPGTGNGGHTQPLPGGRLRVENQPLRTLIKTAYKLQEWQFSGGPSWIDAERFDIEAKAEGNPPLLDVVGPMLRALLEDRFKLKVHREQRELPVFTLAAAKGGLKIRPSKQGDCEPYDPNIPHAKTCGSIGVGKNTLNGVGIRMEDLTKSLASLLGRTVVDKTGLSDPFDVHLEFTRDDTDTHGVSIITALQEEYGLKLESAKAPVEVLVIDHVERPAAN